MRRLLGWLDAQGDRLYGWRGNPLYHSGVIAAALFAVVFVTGVYLLFFYRIGAPWESVRRISTAVPLGSVTRTLHRYASDAMVVAALVHAVRMVVQRRAWGPRALAWLSGVVLLLVVLVSGWTGYVMVWDVQGEILAREGARLFDVLPLFSEPIAHTFDGVRPLPGAFFFLNLFAHVALPVGAGAVFWLHVSRLARPVMMPPRALALWGLGALTAVSVAWPAPVAPAADLFRTPGLAPYDLFFAFFLPLTMPFAPVLVWLGWSAAVLVPGLVPWLLRPKAERRPPASVVDERSCTGCEQCWVDCPYEAIDMVERSDGRTTLVARVDPARCTSCGICAGSCAPMGVGPPGRTGKDQLESVRAFVVAGGQAAGVVLVACHRGAGGAADGAALDGARVLPVTCAGNLHTSVVEYLLRSGYAGVLIASCPARDCWNREGGTWVEQRLFHDREAELQARVDKRRVRLVHIGAGQRREMLAALAGFRAEVRVLEAGALEDDPDVARVCETPAGAGSVP